MFLVTLGSLLIAFENNVQVDIFEDYTQVGHLTKILARCSTWVGSQTRKTKKKPSILLVFSKKNSKLGFQKIFVREFRDGSSHAWTSLWQQNPWPIFMVCCNAAEHWVFGVSFYLSGPTNIPLNSANLQETTCIFPQGLMEAWSFAHTPLSLLMMRLAFLNLWSRWLQDLLFDLFFGAFCCCSCCCISFWGSGGGGCIKSFHCMMNKSPKVCWITLHPMPCL